MILLPGANRRPAPEAVRRGVVAAFTQAPRPAVEAAGAALTHP